MPFVLREGGVPGTGKVIGQYARPQPGKAEEWLDPSHADLQSTFDENAVAKLDQMDVEVTAYIYARYDRETQSSFALMYVRAVNGGNKPNRVVYLAAAIDWLEDSVMSHFYTKKTAILAAADQTALDAVTWDFSQFDAADPESTIEGAMTITD